MIVAPPTMRVRRPDVGYLGGYVQEEGIASGDRFYPLALLKRWRGGDLPTLILPWGLPQLGLAQLYAGAILPIGRNQHQSASAPMISRMAPA